jgi:hypothetical protein
MVRLFDMSHVMAGLPDRGRQRLRRVPDLGARRPTRLRVSRLVLRGRTNGLSYLVRGYRDSVRKLFVGRIRRPAAGQFRGRCDVAIPVRSTR